MFETEQEWRRRGRLQLWVILLVVLAGGILWFLAPHIGLERSTFFPGITGGIAGGLSVWLMLFRKPKPAPREGIRLLEATASRDDWALLIWLWGVFGAGVALWLQWERLLESALLPWLGFVAGLIMLSGLMLILRQMRRLRLSRLHPELFDERMRHNQAKANETGMQAGIQAACLLSVVSLLDLWPLAGHEVGFLVFAAILLGQSTRLTLLNYADRKGNDDA